MTAWRASLAFSDWVRITMPSAAGIAQEAIGFGARSCSTRHIRQLAAIARRSWKQKWAISTPMLWHACSTVVPPGTSTSWPSIVSFGTALLRRLARSDRAVFGDATLHLGLEVADKPLHRPHRPVGPGAD